MAAGLGFKTFTTGEVLTAADVNGYLMQGILVFANATARDAAITSPQEGQYAYLKDTNVTYYYDGSTWVVSGATGDITAVTAGIGISGGGASGDVTITNSMATAIDAKGDLVAGTGADTFARLAVGSNNQVLTADSSTATGLKYTGDWISYTPVWTAATTNPVIGNGTLTGGYRRIGQQVDFWVELTAGSTTTFGTGSWRISLPQVAYTAQWNFAHNCMILDSGVAWYKGYYGVGVDANWDDKFEIYNPAFSAIVQQGTPMTWTTNDGIRVMGRYRGV